MNFNKNLDEMLLVLNNTKVDDDGKPLETNKDLTTVVPGTVDFVEPSYTATDGFANGINDMMNTLCPNGVCGSVEVDSSADTPVEADDIEDEVENDGELDVGSGQIGFEMVDGMLHIALDGMDVHLNDKAVEALKRFLASIEDSSEDDEEDKDEETDEDKENK